jgi:outer membrane protein TolC
MKKTLLILLATAAFGGTCASAQEVLTLKDAVRLGLENGYSIQIAKNSSSIAANNNTYGNAGFLPRVDATVGGNIKASSDKTTRIDGSTTSVSPRTLNANAGVSLSWTLFDGMGMFIAKEKLDLLQKQGETTLRVNMENSAAQIISTYNAIVQQKQLIKVFTETMSISEQRVRIAQTAKRVGSGSDVALLKAEVDYKSDSSNLVQQNLALRNLKADLNQLLSRAPETTFEVEEQLPTIGPIAYPDIAAKAMEQNPSLIEARQELSIQQLGIKEVKSTALPYVTLNSSYTFNKYSYTNGAYDALQSHGPYVGVTAGITLFDGFNIRRNERNAQLQVSSMEVRVQQLEQELLTSILKTYNAYTTAQSVVEIEQKSLELAQKNLTIALKAYEQGSISDIDMRETQRSFVDVSYRLINAQVNLKNTEVELRRISGTLTLPDQQ